MDRQLVAALFAFAALTACAVNRTNYDLAAPGQIAAATMVRGSEFDKLVTYHGPVQEVDQSGAFNTKFFPIDNYHLRGWKGKDGSVVGHQLYMTVTYSGDWQMYGRASFEGGETHPLVEIDRSVVSCAGSAPCTLRETVGLNLSDDFLREHVASGFRVRVEGRTSGYVYFSVPPSYILGYLSTFDGQS